MPQSLAKVIVHIVFSTRDRSPVLTPEYQQRLFAYLAEASRAKDCECYRVGGIDDHVHLAVRLSRIETLADVVEHSKTSSSKWLKTLDAKFARFAWQRGYGAFSVGPKNLNALIDYIDGQAEHHRTLSFQDEYRRFLTEYEIDFDERYVWD